MAGYPRKTCKKAKAASLCLLSHGEEGLATLFEGVGGETCYPLTHRLRRAGRGLCGEPQVGETGDITLLSSSARRALQASLIFGTPRRPIPMNESAARAPHPHWEGDDGGGIPGIPDDTKDAEDADDKAEAEGSCDDELGKGQAQAQAVRTQRGAPEPTRFWRRLSDGLFGGLCCRSSAPGRSENSGN